MCHYDNEIQHTRQSNPLLQRLRARTQKNCANCDKSVKFGVDLVFKIMHFQFFASSSKFCRDKGEKSHDKLLVLSYI